MKEKIWYPSIEYINEVHEVVIEENPSKVPGERVTPESRLLSVLRDARSILGIYKKAAVLMKRIASEHVYEDGNTTTAILVTIDFVENNGKEFKPEDRTITGKVANNHGLYSVEEIVHWIETGDINEEKLPEQARRKRRS